MTFNPAEHLSKIKTKQGMQDYLKVQYRLVWFRDAVPGGTIETEMIHLDTEKQIAVFKATVTNQGAIATGHGSETAKDFTDYIEKAETKAIGRALAALGYGTQFTGDELDEGERIVDTPVDRSRPSVSSLHDLTKPGSYEQHHPSGSTPAQPEPVIDNMQAVLNKCRNRAYKLGIKSIADYNRFCQEVIGKPVPETLVDINRLNVELATREQPKAS